MNIILTGASRGIGFETAINLCKEGAKEVLLISRNKKALGLVKERCLEINSEVCVHILAEDLSKISKEKNLISQITNWTKLDALINNAGYLVNKPYLEISEEDMQNMFEVNVMAPSRLIKNNLNLLMNAQSSHVVNISSMGGFQGSAKFPGLCYYSSSKAALASLTECLAEEYKDTSVKFNCLALGAVQTEMLEEAFPGYKAPLSAKEMATFISDFTLNGHKYFNGKILPVTLSNP